MTQPIIKVLGAYKIEIKDEEIKRFLQESFNDALDSKELEELFLAKQEEISSVVAFDISITNSDITFDIGDFKQPDSDQAVYDEVYLSPDGHSIESKTKPSDISNFRVYFFLHFYDENKPLISTYGQVEIPKIQPLPEYLKFLHQYKLVD